MSRGFIVGVGWGTVVAGLGLVVASQVTDLPASMADEMPPAVSEPLVEIADTAPAAAPDLPQDDVAVIDSADVSAAEAPLIVPQQARSPAALETPQAPMSEQGEDMPEGDSGTVALPNAQTVMPTPDAPAPVGQAPLVLQETDTPPALIGGAVALPDSASADPTPAADAPPPAPLQVAQAPEFEKVPKVAVEPAVPQKVIEEAAKQTIEETAIIRPAPGFGGEVEGVKTGRLPSIGSAPAQDHVAEAEEIQVDDAAIPPIDRFAASFENPLNKPLFAILLQDTGGPDVDREALAAMPFPVSFVIDPTMPDAATAAQIYRTNGKEVLMLASGIPAGATASDLSVSFETTATILPEAVALVDLESGGFQGNRGLATQILALIGDQGRGLMSWDKGLNAASQVARREGMRSALIFRSLDAEDENSPLIHRYLDRAAFKAAQDGRVVVSGKTRPETVAALLEWAVEGRAATVALAPSTAVMTSQ